MIFFDSGFFKRCYISGYSEQDDFIKKDKNYLNFDWKIMSGQVNKKYLGLQFWGPKIYSIMFPIYKSGTEIYRDISLFKTLPLDTKINIYHIRRHKTLVKCTNPINSYFHLDHIQKFVFIKNTWGIMGIYALKDQINYTYISHTPFTTVENVSGIVQRDYPILTKHEITKVSYFKKDCLIYADYYKVVVTKIVYIASRPILQLINIFKPFDIVKEIFVAPENIFLIGHRTVQVLGYNQKNQFRVTSIFSHNHRFEESELYATKIDDDVFIKTNKFIYSFNIKLCSNFVNN